MSRKRLKEGVGFTGPPARSACHSFSYICRPCALEIFWDFFLCVLTFSERTAERNTGDHCIDKTPFWGMLYGFWGWNQIGGWYVLSLFFKVGLCSAISFNRSRRELSIDVAEHRSTFKSKRVVRISVIFQDSSLFSHINQKVSARTFH